MEKKEDKIIRLVSWNVNGIRAQHRKGLLDFIKKAGSFMYCFQETKAVKDQLPDELLNIKGYQSYFSSPVKRGYSGVCTYSRVEPSRVIHDTGIKDIDDEGRVVGTVFGDIIIFNVYFPNGGDLKKRLDYKLDFYDHFLEMIEDYRKQGYHIIFCGDVNTAHKEIDLARPGPNKNNTGFLPVERAWIDRVVNLGYIDTFRRFNREPDNYTWWDYKTRARERNVGWRLDYFFVSEELGRYISDAYIMKDIMGSDHCPVALEIPASLLK